MSMKPLNDLEDIFRPVVGRLAWSVRKGHGSSLTVEFGSPHIAVREPIAASPGASEKVRRNLAKRRVTLVGEWHFWIQYAQWRIQTANFAATSEMEEIALIDDALDELDGQKLLSVTLGSTPQAHTLNFDLGGSLHIWPSFENYDDQWSLYDANGSIVIFKRDGTFVTSERGEEG